MAQNGFGRSMRIGISRVGISLTGLMLAGSALAPAAAQVLDLGGATVSRNEVNGFTTVTNGFLRLTPAANYVYAGAFDDSLGQFGLTKLGATSLTLSGTSNNFGGDTNVNVGSLIAGANNAFSANSLLRIAGPATVDLAGFSQAIDGLAGRGRVINSGGAATLSIITADTALFSGTIAESAGVISLVIGGGGSQTLQSANSYSGGTTLGTGQVRYGNDQSFGTGAIAVVGDAVLSAQNPNRVLANNIAIDNGRSLSISDYATTLAGVISGSGRLVLLNDANVRLTSAGNSFSGGIDAFGGGLTVASNTGLGTGAVNVLGPNPTKLGTTGGSVALANNFALIGQQLHVEATPVGESVTLNGNISGSGAVYLKDTGGTLILNGNNSFSGRVLLNGGTLGVGSNTALGTSNSIVAAGPVTIAAYAAGLTIASTVSARSSVEFDTRGFDLAATGAITNASGSTASVSKVGAGTLTLSGPSLYTGPTTVSAGTLSLTGSLTSNVTVASGATLAGTGTVAAANTVTIASGGTLAPGVGGAGTLTVGNLSLGSGSNLNFDLGAAGVVGGASNDLIVVSNNLLLDGTVNILQQPGFSTGTYRLINYGGTLTDNILTASAAPANFVYAIDTSISGQVNLVVSMVVGGARYWDGSGPSGNGVVNGGNGTWNSTNTNWTDVSGNSALTWGSTIGIFAGVPGLVSVVGPQTFTNLQFTVGGYVLTDAGGGALVTNGASVIDTATNVADVTVLDLPVTGAGSIVKQGVGYLDFVRANSYAGGTDVQAGTVRAYVSGALGTGDVTMANGTRVDLVTGGIALANNFVISGSSTIGVYNGTSSIDGVVSGAGTLVKEEGGTLLLSNAANSYSGGTNVVQGTLALGANTAAGSGTITLQDGTILAAAVSGLVVANDVVTVADGRVDSGPGIFTLNGTILGAGSISQIGTGNLVLNGNNSFTNLGINQGTVTVGSNTAAGAGAIAINDNATLAAGVSGLMLANDIITTGNGIVDQGAGVFTLNGDIGGAGSISAVGTGNLVLNGDNSFVNLGINQGTVTVGSNTAAGAGAIAINDNATLAAGVSGLMLANDIQTTANGIVDQGDGVFTLNGDIGGPGSISAVGTGNLVLNGDNSFVNLGINQGTVTFGTNTAGGSGAIAINDNATLAAGVSGLVIANGIQTTANGIVDSGPGILTLNGGISGAGSISQVGTGNLVLNGNNSFVNLGINQGRVTVGSNTAAGSGDIAINNNATLAAGVSGVTLANRVFTTANGIVDSGAGVFTLSGPIVGAGSITKTGSGVLTLAGINSYAGPTTVSAGRLNVTGTVMSATTVQSGATISGTGAVGPLTVLSGATVAPGSMTGSVGNLTVNGALNLAAGSTYIVDVTPQSVDRISATGPATIAGNVVIAPSGGPYQFGDSIILSSSARTGTFANTTVTGVFGAAIDSSLAYTSTSVLLRLAPRSLVLIGGSTLSGNAPAVAAAFDAAVAGGYNPSPFFALYTQGSNLNTALNQLSGEVHSAERRVLLEDTRVIREAAFDRLNAGLSAIAGAETASSESDGKKITFWLRGAGSWGTADGDAIGSRFETKQRGVLAGIDVAMDDFTFGGMFHYTQTDIDFATLGNSKVKTTGGTLYAGYRQAGGGFAVGLGGTFAGNNAKATRSITATGLQQTLSSDIDGKTYQVFGEVAFDLLPDAATRLEPFGRVAHAQVRVDGFTETGGFAALVGAGQRYDLTVVDAGLRGTINVGGFDLKGSAAWHRTTGDVDGYTFSSITGLGRQAGIRAAALDRNAVAIEAQASYQITPMIALGAGYSGVIGDRNKDHGARATLTVGF